MSADYRASPDATHIGIIVRGYNGSGDLHEITIPIPSEAREGDGSFRFDVEVYAEPDSETVEY